ncbi:divergent PAP2 family protein [Floccifex sp.]|uniref:divergent PAP2 family protein n=1 Tax=Floccifex sp. TaxID=2815810 RepID=UPI002A75D1C6|nr:divergent PAP2 family protein [Floccifex sp.]MDD7282052.1 divergent PAP2 family protein [Erysipelotrichaceae bacterium]MDY2957896.1 divergent PAP2 family protein [Floccifex sp.]
MPDSVYLLVASLISNLIAQVSKMFVYYYRTGEWDLEQVLASGGFPSSHSSTVTTLSVAVGLQHGFDSSLFAITCVFSFIVMYDACHVRYYTGKNIELTQQLIKDLKTITNLRFDDPIYHEKLKTILGHKLIEVVGGFFLGIAVAFALWPIFY